MAQKGVTIGEEALTQALPGLDGECVKLYLYIKYLAEKTAGKRAAPNWAAF